MKKLVLLTFVLLLGSLFDGAFAAVKTTTALSPRPKYRPHYRKPFLKARTVFFKVNVAKYNGKVRTKLDNENRKNLRHKNKNSAKPHKVRKSRYRVLN